MGVQTVSSHSGIGRGGGNKKAMGLSAALLAFLGGSFASLDPAWFQILGHEGGDVQPADENEELENEDGEVDAEIVLKRRERLSETTHNTSDEVLMLCDRLVHAAAAGFRFPVRVPLPVEKVGPLGVPLSQLWLYPSCRMVRASDGTARAKGVRKKKYTIEAELTEDMRRAGLTEPYAFATVDLAAPETWPATLAGAKDTAFQAAP